MKKDPIGSYGTDLKREVRRYPCAPHLAEGRLVTVLVRGAKFSLRCRNGRLALYAQNKPLGVLVGRLIPLGTPPEKRTKRARKLIRRLAKEIAKEVYR